MPLKTYVALLRGINLGARNKVAMPDLRALFAHLGAEDFATYVLAKIVVGNPFPNGTSEPTKLHVTFLAEKPDRVRLRTLDPKGAEPDEFRVIGHEIYLHCPYGYGRSKLSNSYFEKHLGIAATTRNWRTVTKLAELTNA